MSISQENPCILNGKYACLLATSAARIWFITFSLLFLLVSSPLRAAEASDDAANRIVSGIISFTQWPGLKHTPQLCVLPSVSHLSLPQGREQGFSVVWLASEEALAEQPCDAVYFGAQSPQQQVALLEKASSRPMLSIAENNPECTIGASFCLIFHQDKTVFSVNLDSLTRSGVRVSPDVLLLSRKGSQ